MRKAWKIGISMIAGMVGVSVLSHIHNAEVCKVYCERYVEGYDAGYTLGLYQGKVKGAETMYMNGYRGVEYFNDYMTKTREEFVKMRGEHEK